MSLSNKAYDEEQKPHRINTVAHNRVNGIWYPGQPTLFKERIPLPQAEREDGDSHQNNFDMDLDKEEHVTK